MIFKTMFQSFLETPVKKYRSDMLDIDVEPLNWSLFWWFVYHFADDLDDLTDCLSAFDNHLKLVKTKNASDIRTAMMTLTKISEKSPLTVDILSSLWEYFRENFNQSFLDSNRGTLENLAILPKSYEDYFKKPDHFRKNLLTIYIQLVSNHICNSTRPEKEVQRLKPRLRKRVALSNLTEIGIMNLVTLNLGIYSKVRESAFIHSFLEIIREGKFFLFL